MKPLPNPPLHSLHIFPPGSVLQTLLLCLLCLALLLLWWWWRRRRRQPAAAKPEVTASESKGERGAFAQLVRAIRDEHLAHKTYREGCHALSAATKTQLERSSGNDIEEMTVDEIVAWVDKPGVSTFFTRLRRHQFGKQLPDRKDFKKMCRDAPRVLGDLKPSGRKDR